MTTQRFNELGYPVLSGEPPAPEPPRPNPVVALRAAVQKVRDELESASYTKRKVLLALDDVSVAVSQLDVREEAR